MQYRSLFGFHLFYFIVYASTTFLPKYFGELGMSDGQIGMLMSLPAIAGVLCQPFWGTLTDRARQKKHVVIALLAALSAVCFLMNGWTNFTALMLGMTLFNILQLPIAPVYSTISLEYTREIGRDYGPIRLVGTLGYQLGALVIGLILVNSLRGLFVLVGIVLLLSCACACFFPPIAGHQHGRGKVSVTTLLRDRHIVMLLVMVLIGSVTQQFYLSFFSKHMGDLGFNNTVTGAILIVSVMLELPFLYFGDRLFRKTSVWNWLLIGFGLNAVRWLGLGISSQVWVLLLFQIPAVSIMACFEFFPALYINERVPDTLKGSAQNALMIVSFGIAKIIGSLLGGFVADGIGIPAVFGLNALLLAIACAAFYRPTRALDTTQG